MLALSVSIEKNVEMIQTAAPTARDSHSMHTSQDQANPSLLITVLGSAAKLRSLSTSGLEADASAAIHRCAGLESTEVHAVTFQMHHAWIVRSQSQAMHHTQIIVQQMEQQVCFKRGFATSDITRRAFNVLLAVERPVL
jgi:hypothetical protein